MTDIIRRSFIDVGCYLLVCLLPTDRIAEDHLHCTISIIHTANPSTCGKGLISTTIKVMKYSLADDASYSPSRSQLYVYSRGYVYVEAMLMFKCKRERNPTSDPIAGLSLQRFHLSCIKLPYAKKYVEREQKKKGRSSHCHLLDEPLVMTQREKLTIISFPIKRGYPLLQNLRSFFLFFLFSFWCRCIFVSMAYLCLYQGVMQRKMQKKSQQKMYEKIPQFSVFFTIGYIGYEQKVTETSTFTISLAGWNGCHRLEISCAVVYCGHFFLLFFLLLFASNFG